MSNREPIINIADNTWEMYESKIRLFHQWFDLGDSFSGEKAREQTTQLVQSWAEEIRKEYGTGRYTRAEVAEAVEDVLGQYPEFAEYEMRSRLEFAQTPIRSTQEELTDADREHIQKYEALAQRLGLEELKTLIPVSQDKVRQALERGDKHLNKIPLWKWDVAAGAIAVPGLSLGEKVCLLKHVAKWHYA